MYDINTLILNTCEGINIISKAIKKLRKKRGYTQKQVADLLGLDRSTYSYYELGKIKPDVTTVMKLSEIFDVHYTTILEPEDRQIFLDVYKNVAEPAFKISEKSIVLPTNGNLTKGEQDILMALRLLSDESRKDALEFISKKFKDDRNLRKNNDFE